MYTGKDDEEEWDAPDKAKDFWKELVNLMGPDIHRAKWLVAQKYEIPYDELWKSDFTLARIWAVLEGEEP